LSVLRVELSPTIEPVVTSCKCANVINLVEARGEESIREIGRGEECATSGRHICYADIADWHCKTEVGSRALFVAFLSEEEIMRERVLCLIVGLGIVVVEGIHGSLVAVGAKQLHVGKPEVLELKVALGSHSLSVALLAIEDKTNRPANGYRVEAREATGTTDVHGSLELAERGAIVGVDIATIDIRIVILEVSILTDRANERDVREGSCGIRLDGSTICAVVALETIGTARISKASVADAEAVLNLAAETIIGIELVIPTTESDEVVTIDRATEPLEAVIVAVGNLDVVNLRAATDGAEGKTINLLICSERITSELDTHITDDAAIVCIVLATMLSARPTLDLHLYLIVARLAAEDDTAPVTRLTAASLRG